MKVREEALYAGDEREYTDCYLSFFGRVTTGVFEALQAFEDSHLAVFRRGGTMHIIEFPDFFRERSLAEFEAFRTMAQALGKHLHERCPQMQISMYLGTGLSGGYEATRGA